MALIDKLNAIGDAIRAKTGKTDKLTLEQMPLEIESITGGGGVSDSRIKYVTFIGLGGVELYKMPVIVGDTCHDPVTKGYIETPTKESTAQYNYTHSGWSLTDGGSASSSALTNVTEDRTVYAAFASTVNKYTITYYDSDGTTVLTTKSVAYGATPTYIPEKSGYTLSGWQPEIVPVTGDASYIAQWEEKITFAGSSWEDIITATEEGKAQTLFAVGDTRTEMLGDETVTYTIVDFNKDITSVNGIGNATGYAGVTIVSNVLATTKQMFSTASTSGTGKWSNSIPKSYLNTTIKPLLPSALLSGIKSVRKEQQDSANSPTSLYNEYEDIWIPSFKEVNYYVANTRYSYFTTKESRIGYKADGTASSYWLRSGSNGGGTAVWYSISTTGGDNSVTSVTAKHGIRFGFCI